MAAPLRALAKYRTFSVMSAVLRSTKECRPNLLNARDVVAARQISSTSKVSSLNQQMSENEGYSSERLQEVLMEQHEDMPDQTLANPYQKPHKKCILCQYNVPLDYKNIKLLSQFVSPYTGQIYGAQVTGLCVPMQKRISKLVRRARRFGFMPYLNKERDYLADPKLFNPFRRN